jgi:hypothetical protein
MKVWVLHGLGLFTLNMGFFEVFNSHNIVLLTDIF